MTNTAVQAAEDPREAGNKAFRDQQYLKAAAQYTSAIKKFAGTDAELAVLHRCDTRCCHLKAKYLAAAQDHQRACCAGNARLGIVS